MRSMYADLNSFAAALATEAEAHADYIADTRQITMLGTEELSIPVGDDGTAEEFGITQHAHRQIGTHLGIPAKFYDRLRETPELRGLLDTNVNRLLRHQPARRMVRTAHGNARAFLSDRYRRRDNFELVEHVLPILAGIPDVEFDGLGVTDTRMYLTALSPRVRGTIKEGDDVQAGVRITNSEIGLGALKVEPIVFRLVCSNGMVAGRALRAFHVGRQAEVLEDAYRVFTDETMRKDDEAFFSKVADVVRAAVDDVTFGRIVAQLREAATGEPMVDPLDAVEKLGQRLTLAEDEQRSVLRHLIEGGDLTRWGAINAVTRAAQDVESMDRSMELEELGGSVLDMPDREWRALAAA